MTSTAANFSFYENAQAFEDFHAYTSYYRRAQSAMVDLVQAKPGQLVLEIGCATGETTRKIAQQYPEATIIGVDFRPNIVEEAKRLSPDAEYPNLTFRVGDMTQPGSFLPVDGRYPDILCSLYSFHHIPDPIENKYQFAQFLYQLPVETFRVVLLDAVTRYSATRPEYPQAVLDQWNALAQESYRSVLLNRYVSLLNQGVSHAEAYEKASIAASYTRDIEVTMGQTTSMRDDEFPVTYEEMLSIWMEAGFSVLFHTPVNEVIDSVFVFQK